MLKSSVLDLDITLLLLIPTSRDMDLDWEAPSHSEDVPILCEGCSVGKGFWQREFCLCTVDKKHLFFLQQNPCVSLGVDAVAIHSPPSVVWMKDSGVLLTGRGGVTLSSAAWAKVSDSNLILNSSTPTLNMIEVTAVSSQCTVRSGGLTGWKQWSSQLFRRWKVGVKVGRCTRW